MGVDFEISTGCQDNNRYGYVFEHDFIILGRKNNFELPEKCTLILEILVVCLLITSTLSVRIAEVSIVSS
jgi:hypothetical protein